MDDWLVSFIIFRSLERLLIIAIGGFSIWMGWRLFLMLEIDANQSASMSGKNLSFQITKVGPGAFFALFGAAIIMSSFWNLPSAKEFTQLMPGQKVAGSFTLGRQVDLAPALGEQESTNPIH